MFVHCNPASSPINISSDSHSSGTIIISSDSSPAQFSDTLAHPWAETPRQRSPTTDRSISLGSIGSRLASPAPGPRTQLPAYVSRPSIASRSMLPSRSTVHTRYHDTESELMLLHDQLEALQTENSELKGQVEALRCVFILPVAQTLLIMYGLQNGL